MGEREQQNDKAAIARAVLLALVGAPRLATELAAWLRAHRCKEMQVQTAQTALTFAKPPLEVRRDAVEENTGEKFSFTEKLNACADYVPDLQPGDVDARTRALADVCLVILNTNDFAYVY